MHLEHKSVERTVEGRFRVIKVDVKIIYPNRLERWVYTLRNEFYVRRYLSLMNEGKYEKALEALDEGKIKEREERYGTRFINSLERECNQGKQADEKSHTQESFSFMGSLRENETS